MRLRDLSGLLLSVAAVAAIPTAHADSWVPASTQRYDSADGAWRLTIEPRALASNLAYFRDQVDGKERPGGEAGEARTAATGTMEHCTGGLCRRVWQRALLNDVAPVDAVVTNGGRVITFDNWHSMGFGATTVVIYTTRGAPLRRLSLPEFLPRDYVIALPRSVSSLHWRGEPKALGDGRRVTVPVVVPRPGDDDDSDLRHVDVVFDLASGVVSLPPDNVWRPALAQASAALARQRTEQAAREQRFLQPARAPVNGDERAWHQYLEDAFFRLDRDGRDSYPAIKVLRMPTAPDYAASANGMREALRDARGDDGALMLGSPSQAGLVDFLTKETRHMSPGALSGPRIYLALDDTRFAQAKAHLSPLGAKLVQLDPAKGIPQRPDRLREYAKRDRAEIDDSLFE
jgi:hypothetical protein